MKFKTGFIVGAAVGYVLGSRAGRERYEQIMSMLGRMTGNERFQSMSDKGKAYADLAGQRVRGSVGEAFHGAADKIRHSDNGSADT